MYVAHGNHFSRCVIDLRADLQRYLQLATKCKVPCFWKQVMWPIAAVMELLELMLRFCHNGTGYDRMTLDIM